MEDKEKNVNENATELSSIGIVGGDPVQTDALRRAMERAGYRVVYSLPYHRALVKQTRVRADAVVLIPPSPDTWPLTISIDRQGTVRLEHADPTNGDEREAAPALTNREKQSLALVVMGLTNQQISEKLFISESTVKSHLNSAYRKLGVRSRSEAARRITDPMTGLGTGILAITGPGLHRSSGGR